jgi:Calcineurin-like phosphoesterase
LAFQRSLRLGLATVALAVAATASAATSAPLRVGIIGDQTYSTDLDQSYVTLARAVEILAKEDVACVLHTGDLLESTVAPDTYRDRFAQATALLDRLGKPWHLAAGDHDVSPPLFVPDSPDRSREQLFRELYRKRVPQLTEALNHSFDQGGYHFVALNSQERLCTDPRWGDVFLNQVSSAQLAWLEDDLRKRRGARGTVVFLHQPMWYNWSNWAPVHRLLRRYRVLAVVAGHFHYDQDEGDIDGIRYVVVGAAGGVIKDASRDAGRVQHVTVMTLRGRTVEFRLLPVDGGGPLQLTTRADMDRVQAVATELGLLFNFSPPQGVCVAQQAACVQRKPNAICVKDNRLYGPGAQPAVLSLVQVGNPIDVPLTIDVQLRGDTLALIDPHYTPDACRQVSGGQCVLAPGARIESSNTSSVVLNDQFAPLPPLWESGLEVRPGSTIAAGHPIELKVRATFRAAQGEQFVEGSARATITACEP